MADCLQAQELLDLIVDYLHTSPISLRSCALVSSRFVSRSQYHCFRCIYLRPNDTTATKRLDAVLTFSPHLLWYIRQLDINQYDLESLHFVARIPWSRLSKLTLHWHNREPLPAQVLELLKRIVGFPTICVLEFGGSWQSVPLWQMFMHCCPGLDTLNFVRDAHLVPLPVRYSLCPPSRPKITRLSFDHQRLPMAPQMLLFLHCPVDVSALTHVHICHDAPTPSSLTPSFINLLMHGRTTITSLHLSKMGESLASTIRE